MSLDLVAWAERFIATPSVSREGNRAIAQRAGEMLLEAGLEPRIETVEAAGRIHHAVLADLAPAASAPAAEGLLLVTHLDTVPPGDPDAWTATGGNPLRPVRSDDHLYGLGSADAKVDLICKVAALEAVDAGQLTCPVRIAGTFGEEIGLLGARWLIDSGLTRGFRYALVGEPSGLVPIHAHKGYAVFEARVGLGAISRPARGRLERRVFRGRAVHSSTPDLGVNAIELALRDLDRPGVRGLVALEGGGAVNRVPELCTATVLVEGEEALPRPRVHSADALVAFHRSWTHLLERLAGRRDTRFDPDHTVGSLGRVRIREGVAILDLDLRPLPGVDPEEAVKALEQGARVSCRRRNPPLATPADSALMQALARARAAAGLPPRAGTKPTCTEAGLLAEAGLEAVVLGPGESTGNIHRPNEHTRISQLELARRIYGDTIRSLCMDRGEPCSS